MTKTLYILLAFVLIANVAFLNWQFYKNNNDTTATQQNEAIATEIAGIKAELTEIKDQKKTVAATTENTQIPHETIISQEHDPDLVKGSVDYMDGETVLRGYWAKSACSFEKKQPVVVIFHHLRGIETFVKDVADKVADKYCYNAFVPDLFGREYDFLALRNDEIAMEQSLKHRDVEYSRNRIKAGFDYLKSKDFIDMDRVAVIGYAGGGTIAVREAFAGANYKAVSSFYNNMNTFPIPEDPAKITANIQIHISKDDTRNKPGVVESVKNKIGAMNVPVTFYEYEGRQFATPNQYGEDSSYNAQADKESFDRTMALIKKTLSK